MDLKTKKKTFDFDIAAIQKRVIANRKKPIKTLADLQQMLMLWWCRHYNKPYKCQEVLDYTLEELLFEYFDLKYYNDPEAMKKDENKTAERSEEDEEWIKGMAGEGYLSPDEQEAALQEAGHELEELPLEFMDDGGFSESFDD